jgi:hypothetical protein
MQYLQTVETRIPIVIHQTSNRHQAARLFAVTVKGTGEIIDINSDGLSFGCLYPHSFPSKMKIDILGENGILIKEISVETAWQNSRSHRVDTGGFEKITGVKFIGLSRRQLKEIEQLREQLDCETCAMV